MSTFYAQLAIRHLSAWKKKCFPCVSAVNYSNSDSHNWRIENGFHYITLVTVFRCSFLTPPFFTVAVNCIRRAYDNYTKHMIVLLLRISVIDVIQSRTFELINISVPLVTICLSKRWAKFGKHGARYTCRLDNSHSDRCVHIPNFIINLYVCRYIYIYFFFFYNMNFGWKTGKTVGVQGIPRWLQTRQLLNHCSSNSSGIPIKISFFFFLKKKKSLYRIKDCPVKNCTLAKTW